MRGPNNKDYRILGPILGSPYFGKLPFWVDLQVLGFRALQYSHNDNVLAIVLGIMIIRARPKLGPAPGCPVRNFFPRYCVDHKARAPLLGRDYALVRDCTQHQSRWV